MKREAQEAKVASQSHPSLWTVVVFYSAIVLLFPFVLAQRVFGGSR